MFNVGGGEVLVILLLALIVLGPDKLPQAAKQAGKYLSEFRRMSNGFQQELRDAMDLTPSTGTSTSSGATSRAANRASPSGDAAGTNGSSAPDPLDVVDTVETAQAVVTPAGDTGEPARPVVDASGSNLATDAPHVAPAMRTPPPEVPGGIAVEGPSASFS